MESSKFSAILFICMLFISSVTPILGCGFCGKPTKPKTPKVKTPKSAKTPTPVVKPPIKVPPVTLPPVKPPVDLPPPVGILPPVGLPKLPPVGLPKLPPVGELPPVGGLPKLPPVGLPKLPPVGELPPVGGLPNLPPVGLPKLPPVGELPPVGLPPVTLPPVTGAPPKTKGDSCPIDTLKLGACLDLLGGLVHIGLGDPVVNQCCPIISGLAEIEAAVCLCTTIKIKLLNLKVFVPIALQVLLTCGKNPPPGYDCSI